MKGKSLTAAAVGALLVTAGTAFAEGNIHTVDITGVMSWDGLGSANNEILLVDLGGPAVMNGIGWDVGITTFGESWVSEARMYFDDNINPDLSGLFLATGFGTDQPSGPFGDFFSSDGILKLADVNIPDIVLADGILRIEFFESFDDVADVADAVFKEQSLLHIQYTGGGEVPAPGALALLGVAGLVGSRRRRA